MFTDQQYQDEIKARLANPAVPDIDIEMYIVIAKRDVSTFLYSESDYISQVLDTACYLLSIDNKFPEISSISQNGITTSFSGNDVDRWKKRITERRQALVMDWDS